MKQAREHWQDVYGAKSATDVSWYAAHLVDSLRLISEYSSVGARTIDVGGGASTLVDDLLDRGYRDLTVLDVSEKALDVARSRLGDRASLVTWFASDITQVALERERYDLWHDRAVLHFLTQATDRQAYANRLRESLAPGGHAVIATFALSGPERCSGLDVVRYDTDAIAAVLGRGFSPVTSFETTHTTPRAVQQRFLYAVFRKD